MQADATSAEAPVSIALSRRKLIDYAHWLIDTRGDREVPDAALSPYVIGHDLLAMLERDASADR